MAWSFLNNNFISQDQVSISPFDRGFLFGDSVYEVIPVYNKKPFLLYEHLNRLENSLQSISIISPFSQEKMTSIINELIQRNSWDNQYVYIQISRGNENKRQRIPDLEITPTIFLFSSKLAINPYRDESNIPGLKLICYEDPRWLRCDIKSTSLLPNIYALLDQNNDKSDEVLMHKSKIVTEASAGSIFFVSKDTVSAPILDSKVLHGITRNHIKKILDKMAINFIERDIHIDELPSAREIWYVSSTKEIQPVSQIDNFQVNYNESSQIWREVLNEYIKTINS
tara:strand:+ start:20785 stop:21633 length:849 start_codon:yes stop_codon:yes gene_type:complete